MKTGVESVREGQLLLCKQTADSVWLAGLVIRLYLQNNVLSEWNFWMFFVVHFHSLWQVRHFGEFI